MRFFCFLTCGPQWGKEAFSQIRWLARSGVLPPAPHTFIKRFVFQGSCSLVGSTEHITRTSFVFRGLFDAASKRVRVSEKVVSGNAVGAFAWPIVVRR